MAQRLVLGTDNTVTLAELRDFVTKAEKIGLSGRSEIDFQHVPAGDNGGKDRFRFSIVVPKDRHMKITNIVRKTKTREKVDERIAERKSAIARGEKVEGYVPPVGKDGPPKIKKGKCIECGTRKPLIKGATVLGKQLMVVKKHQSKGSVCPGSEKPPMKFKNKG